MKLLLFLNFHIISLELQISRERKLSKFIYPVNHKKSCWTLLLRRKCIVICFRYNKRSYITVILVTIFFSSSFPLYLPIFNSFAFVLFPLCLPLKYGYNMNKYTPSKQRWNVQKHIMMFCKTRWVKASILFCLTPWVSIRKALHIFLLQENSFWSFSW